MFNKIHKLFFISSKSSSGVSSGYFRLWHRYWWHTKGLTSICSSILRWNLPHWSTSSVCTICCLFWSPGLLHSNWQLAVSPCTLSCSIDHIFLLLLLCNRLLHLSFWSWCLPWTSTGITHTTIHYLLAQSSSTFFSLFNKLIFLLCLWISLFW